MHCRVIITCQYNSKHANLQTTSSLVSSLGGGPSPPSEVLGPFGGPNTQCFSLCFIYYFYVSLSYV